MTNPLPLALASLIMPYTSVHFPSSHKTAHGNGHCHILLGDGRKRGNRILTYTSHQLNVVGSRKIFCKCSLPGSRFFISLKEKYLNTIAGSV